MTIGRISEDFIGNNLVHISIDGVLDKGLVSVLCGVCDVHIQNGKGLLLDFQGVLHITGEGRDFLEKIVLQADIINLPGYIKIQKRWRHSV